MERQIDKSKHLIFEHDTYQANIEALRQDIKDRKKIVLFVGAGINLGGDSSIDISWNGLLYGLTPIFELGGYKELYNHIFNVLWDKE